MIVGWCTPTEAAALGAVSVMVLAACYGELTWKAFVKSLDGALRVTVMAFLIIFGLGDVRAGARVHRRLERADELGASFHVTPLGCSSS